MSFFFARSLLVRVTIFCASSMVSTESLRPPNHPIPVHRVGAVVSVTILMPHPRSVDAHRWAGQMTQIKKLIHPRRAESLTIRRCLPAATKATCKVVVAS